MRRYSSGLERRNSTASQRGLRKGLEASEGYLSPFISQDVIDFIHQAYRGVLWLLCTTTCSLSERQIRGQSMGSISLERYWHYYCVTPPPLTLTMVFLTTPQIAQCYFNCIKHPSKKVLHTYIHTPPVRKFIAHGKHL